MKYIFDFDDVLFDTRKFKERIYSSVEKIGITRETEERYYQEFRKYAFSLNKFLSWLFTKEGKQASVNEIYEEVMSDCPSLLNLELVEFVRNLAVENCLIITSGDEEFQLDKIRRSGIESLFSVIVVVPDSKKEAVEKLCAENKDEKIIFIDDKARFLEDLDLEKYPNLKTILYTRQNIEKLQAQVGT